MLSQISSFFNYILVWPITNVLVAIYHFLYVFHVPFAFGFSIIILTVIIRLILYPLTFSQLKTTQKMQKLTPHLDNLKKLHKNDAKKLQSETMKLYKEHGVNPAAGCLPALVQLPIIWALYAVLQHVVSLSPGELLKQINQNIYFSAFKLNSVWDQNFFGLPLGIAPSKMISHYGVLVLLVPVLTGVLQFFQSKLMFPPKSKDEKQVKKDDFASAMQTQSLFIFPVMIGFFSYSLPLGLSLYWNTFTIFGIIQQYHVQEFEDIKKLWVKIRGEKNNE